MSNIFAHSAQTGLHHVLPDSARDLLAGPLRDVSLLDFSCSSALYGDDVSMTADSAFLVCGREDCNFGLGDSSLRILLASSSPG